MPDEAIKKMKVWRGLEMRPDGKQHAIIIATDTRKQAAELLGISLFILSQWWTETANVNDVQQALAQPYTKIDTGAI